MSVLSKSKQQEMDSKVNPRSRVAEFYSNRGIFITGATGFMGKVLIHKLLTVSPNIRAIYVLIRPKKGLEPEERLKNLFETAIFKDLAPQLKAKVVPIAGDITLPKLGISGSDELELLNDVSVIFHSAATVKFDEDLSKSVAMNVQGTMSVIDLARKMGDNLVSFVHVSTAYSHCYKSSIAETFYPNEMTPQQIIGICQETSPDIIDSPKMTRTLINNHPNTYTFTKALAEQALQEQARDLPLSIFRPSIVVAAHKEPFPGWIDNLNGPTGIFAAYASGILRTMRVMRKKKADIIPIDFVVNMMCVIGWKSGQRKPVDLNNNSIPIYNYTSGECQPLLWGDFEASCVKHVITYPLEFILWYPRGSFKSSAILDHICCLLFHFLPAVIVDLVRCLVFKRPFLLKIVTRMTKSMKVLKYFGGRQWTWSNTNVHDLNDELDNADHQLFNCDLRKLPDWDPFIENYILGIRHFLLKNSPSTMETSRRRLKILYVADVCFQMGFLFIAAYVFVTIWKYAMSY